MADVVWALWGVFEDADGPRAFDAHVLAPESWTEAQVLETAAEAYLERGDEDALETAKMLRRSGEATPLVNSAGPAHALEVRYDANAGPYRLTVVESWRDVEFRLG